MQPRLTALYGDADKSYGYSGIVMQPNVWTRELKEIKLAVEKKSGHTFSVALLNLYRDGNDSMGWHRDNEKELGKDPVIASVNFGAKRRFQLREYITKSNLRNLDLTQGSLLVMQGESQHHWEHRVPKTSRFTEPRINITFRLLK